MRAKDVKVPHEINECFFKAPAPQRNAELPTGHFLKCDVRFYVLAEEYTRLSLSRRQVRCRHVNAGVT